MSFVVHNRSFGYLGRTGWVAGPTNCVTFASHATARSAAKAAATRYGCTVSVIKAASPPRRMTVREKQSMACRANKAALDKEIAMYVAAGTLKTSVPHGRKYGY